MDFTKEEKKWLDKCKAEPYKYNLCVDNDLIHINQNDKCVFAFSSYGHEFALQLLRYVGCCAEMV